MIQILGFTLGLFIIWVMSYNQIEGWPGLILFLTAVAIAAASIVVGVQVDGI
jgi:hypothetical protein